MKLRLFWIGVAAAAAAAIACGGGDDGPSPEQRFGEELARVNNVTALMQGQTPLGAWHPAHHEAFVWWSGNSSDGASYWTAEVGDYTTLLTGTAITDINDEWFVGLRVFSDVRVIPHELPNGNPSGHAGAFGRLNRAIQDATYIAAAPWAQAGHYNDVTAELRAAHDNLVGRANPAGSINRIPLLATIHDAFTMLWDATGAMYFTAGPVQVSPIVPAVGGLPSEPSRLPTYRAAIGDILKLEGEALNAVNIAFNRTTFPLTQSAVDARYNALNAEMEAFRHSREPDTALMLLHTTDLRQEVMSARIGSGILEEGAEGADGIALSVGFRRLPLAGRVDTQEGTALWSWEIVGAPEGVRFSAGGQVELGDPATEATEIVEGAAVTGEGETGASIYFPATLWIGEDRITAPVTFTVRVTLYGSLPDEEDAERPQIMASNTFPITLVP
jgi:hypothetical protein